MIKRCMRIFIVVCAVSAMLRAQEECGDGALSQAAREYIDGCLKGGEAQVVVFVVRFTDFGCELCLNNFLDFCDSLRARGARLSRGRVGIFFTRDKTPLAYQKTTMEEWIKGNGINFPVYVIPAKSLPPDSLQHSLVYVSGKGGRMGHCGIIPLPLEAQNLILQELCSQER